MAMLPFTVGRTRESMDFIDNIKEGQPALLYGAFGIGKSHILSHMVRPWLDKEGIPYLVISRFSSDSDSLGDILDKITNSPPRSGVILPPEVGTIGITPEVLDRIKRASSWRQMTNLIAQRAFEHHPGKSFVLVIDDMELLTKRDVQILEDIDDSVYICGAYNERGSFGALKHPDFFMLFSRVNLHEFDKPAAENLIERCMRHFNVTVKPEDLRSFKNTILTGTFYMTLGIVETLSKLRNKAVKKEDIYDMVVHVGGRREMSMYIKWVALFMVYPMFMAMMWRATGALDLAYFARGIAVIFLVVRLAMPR